MTNDKTYYQNLIELSESIQETYLDKHFTDDLQDAIHQEVDNALIYYHAQRYVMSETRNEDAYFEQNGGEVTANNYQEIIGQLAYFALCEDLQEYLDQTRLEEIKEYLETRQDRKVA